MGASQLPAFQFYPDDWMNDSKLRLCSLEAQGFWIRLMCVMHTCEPYGHLTFRNNLPANPRDIRGVTGVHTATVNKLLSELERWGVFSRTKDGVIYSRRMVKDAYLRLIRANAGSKGGNARASILPKQNGKQTDQQTDQQNTPSPSPSPEVNGVSQAVRSNTQPDAPARAKVGSKTRLAHSRDGKTAKKTTKRRTTPDPAAPQPEHETVASPPIEHRRADPPPAELPARELSPPDRNREIREFVIAHWPRGEPPGPIHRGEQPQTAMLESCAMSWGLDATKALWELFTRQGNAFAAGQHYSIREFVRQAQEKLVEDPEYPRLKRLHRESRSPNVPMPAMAGFS